MLGSHFELYLKFTIYRLLNQNILLSEHVLELDLPTHSAPSVINCNLSHLVSHTRRNVIHQ